MPVLVGSIKRAGQEGEGCFGAEFDQTKSIEIYGATSVCAAGIELKSSIVRGGPGHDGIAAVDIGADLLSDHFPDFSAISSDINACTDFQQPDGKPSSQAWWGIFNHDDQHRPILPGLQRPRAWLLPVLREGTGRLRRERLRSWGQDVPEFWFDGRHPGISGGRFPSRS